MPQQLAKWKTYISMETSDSSTCLKTDQSKNKTKKLNMKR